MSRNAAAVQASAAVRLLPRGGRVLVSGASSESSLLASAIMGTADLSMTVTGVFVPGLNTATYLPNAQCRVETFFMTPELRAHPTQVDFLPLCYQDILDRLTVVDVHAACMSVSPPDEHGRCSFGPAVDFLPDLWPRIPLRIGHVNPLLPRTRGPSIPLAAFDAVVEHAEPMKGSASEDPDETTCRIASIVASFVPDGATLQTGLGKLPSAILRALHGHRNLRIHSGLVGDAVLDLVEAGATAGDGSVVAGVAIGSPRLYEAATRDPFRFEPVSRTHSVTAIAEIPSFISINSGLEVDLLGQVHAEVAPGGLMSGPGGASDFARGARLSPGGLRIVALAADAARGAVTRIVPPGSGRGPVSLSRFDVDIVATEHGAADLRGLGHRDRASALVRVAAPAHRDALEAAWERYAKIF